MARIWVTGCCGFIAREVIAQLVARGDQVGGIGYVRGKPPLDDSCRVDGKVDALRLKSLLEKTGFPDTVIHLAGGSSVGKSFETPVEDHDRSVGSTVELLNWIGNQAPSPNVVVVSTAAVYGEKHGPLIPEHADTIPVSPYGSHKLAMEKITVEMARRWQIPTVIVRLFSIYGRGLKKQFFFEFCERLRAPTSPVILLGTGQEARDYLEVRDAAGLLVLAANHAHPSVPIVNGGSGKATRIEEAAALVLAAWHSQGGAPHAIEFGGTGGPGNPTSLVADVTRISEWQFRPGVSLKSGIASYVDWYRREVAAET